MLEPRDPQSSLPALSYADSLAHAWRDFLLLVARVAVGWIFMQSGLRKLMDLALFAKSMPARGLPEALGYVAAPVEFIGGILIILGLATRYAALVILAFTIIASLTSHAYWTYSPGDPARATQATQFWKNMTMQGGLLLLFLTAAGRFSLDWLLKRK